MTKDEFLQRLDMVIYSLETAQSSYRLGAVGSINHTVNWYTDQAVNILRKLNQDLDGIRELPIPCN
jgi:hypothetical protein